jgi:putative MFS transporter
MAHAPMPETAEDDAEPGRLTAYHWRLLLFLGVASFFEGYDHIALSQILPEFRREMNVGEGEGGLIVGVIMVGTILAFALVRQADRYGRKAMLTWTIAGYTVFSFLTGLAPNVYVFTALQFVARVFLIGEWAVSMVYAAESFPPRHRGLMIGLINATASFGAVACAGLVPLLIRDDVSFGLGWRMVYFVGTVPLLLLAFARRGLKETERFEQVRNQPQGDLFEVLRTPYRNRVFLLALIWSLTYVSTQTAVTFWKEYAVDPEGPLRYTPGQVGQVVAIAAVAAMPFVFAVGWLLDRLGRRGGAVVVYVLTCAAVVAAYTVHDAIGLQVAMVGAIFGASAVLPVLNAFSTELFPTHLRSNAFAWANNLLGRIGYVAGPVAVGFAAEEVGWGMAVAPTAIGPFIALILILTLLPETKGRSLEETSALDQEARPAGA